MTTKTYTLTEQQRQTIAAALDVAFDGDDDHWPFADEVPAVIDLFRNPIPDVPPIPLWQGPLFTDEDRNQMVLLMMEEVKDTLKDRAHDALDNCELVELIGYLHDPELITDILEDIQDPEQPEVTGDFLRVHDDDMDDYAARLDFAKRFCLIDEAEENLTELGVKYLQEWNNG